MNATTLKLALKKQSLQIESERLRVDFGFNAAGLAPAFAGADLAVDGVHWLRRNPGLVVAVLVALVVIRPRRAWRWGRRAFIGWQAWRRLRDFVDRRLPA
jgi:hypothetical protein